MLQTALASLRPCVFAPVRLCVFASGSLLFGSSSCAPSVLEEGGTYREALQRPLASQDAPDCHETAARRHQDERAGLAGLQSWVALLPIVPENVP